MPMIWIYWLFTLVFLPTFIFLSLHTYWAVIGVVIFGLWALVGFFDLFIGTSNIRRNYPVAAYMRYGLEYIRPEIRQYFIAGNTDERPFTREFRNMVYRRAKQLDDTLPFGTEQDILAPGYISALHSMAPKVCEPDKARIIFGGEECSKPYNASRFNISAMSFGALSANAIRAMNLGAQLGGFGHNTGEGGISPYHLEFGGDLIWQIGTGYFGCRDTTGNFDQSAFTERASLDQVKMIEIKISQGAKPSHGGLLPAAKVTKEIAQIRLVPEGQDVLSPPTHATFSTPVGLLEFVQLLREASGGKPVGFKLCLGRLYEFMSITKAMIETGIYPDFITVDGAEGGTGAAPVEFSNRLGVPCLNATYLVNQILIGSGVRDKTRLISSGKTASGFGLLSKIALGADAVNAARTMMIAVGCIQAQSCNTNRCPTGVTTQDPRRARSIDVRSKSLHVKNFHHGTIHSFLDLCGAMGYSDPEELSPADIYQRFNRGTLDYLHIFPSLEPGQLLGRKIPTRYEEEWKKADSQKFGP